MQVPICETLESRQLLAAQPTAYEQYLIALINRARANPTAEAQRQRLSSINEGLPAGTITAQAKQPLAINASLTSSAQKHSKWMIAADIFAHSGSGESSPYDRMLNAGYPFAYPGGAVENIGWRGEYPKTPDPLVTTTSLHNQLIVDGGIKGRSHRVNLFDPDMTEIGVGFVAGAFRDWQRTWNAWMLTEDLAYRPGDHFITGITYADLVKRNAFYTPGEGLGGILITATRSSDGAVFTTRTLNAGGYALQVPDGTYTVVASGGGLPEDLTRSEVVVGGLNVLVDFRLWAATTTPRLDATGTLRIDGTAGNDVISVYTSSGKLAVKLNGVLRTYTLASVTRVEIWGWQGNDTISGSPLADMIYGLWGNDSVRSSGGADTLRGGSGRDTLSGGAGNDSLDGGLGDDSLLGGDGSDVLSDTSGKDTLDGGTGSDLAIQGRADVLYRSIELPLI